MFPKLVFVMRTPVTTHVCFRGFHGFKCVSADTDARYICSIFQYRVQVVTLQTLDLSRFIRCVIVVRKAARLLSGLSQV
jgi:hypothetical protein